MPGFIKTRSDEEKWNRAKEIVKDQGKEGSWALVNYIYKKMHGSTNRFERIAYKVSLTGSKLFVGENLIKFKI